MVNIQYGGNIRRSARQETRQFTLKNWNVPLWIGLVAMLMVRQAFAEDFLGLRESPPEKAQVVVVQDSGAISAYNPRQERVRALVDQGIQHLSGKDKIEEAWRSYVTRDDVVGIKVFSSPGASSGTRPAVVEGIIQGLLASGLAAKQIIIWDRHWVDLKLAGFVALANRYGVQALGSAQAGYDEAVFYENPVLGRLVWGDLEFGRKGEGVGRKSFVSKLITQKLTKIINVSPLSNHNVSGVLGNLYSLALGSVDNRLRFDNHPERLARAIPELYALPELGDRVVLNIVDALICQYQGEEGTSLHNATMLGELRFSTDPVALDVLSIQELDRQRTLSKVAPYKPALQIYTNASLLEIGVSDPRNIVVLRPRSE